MKRAGLIPAPLLVEEKERPRDMDPAVDSRGGVSIAPLAVEGEEGA